MCLDSLTLSHSPLTCVGEMRQVAAGRKLLTLNLRLPIAANLYILVLLLVVKNTTKGGNMLKTVKIPEEAYKAAKKLGKELEKEKLVEGVYNVKLTTAISFAITHALEEIERKHRFKAAAGAWSDKDAEAIRKLIHEDRRFRTRNLTF